MADTQQFISIVGDYFQVIANLFERLVSLKGIQKSAALAGPIENPFSAAIAILGVVGFESIFSRLKHVHKISGSKKPYQHIAELYSDFPYSDRLKEVYVIRDILAHNHLWKIEFKQMTGEIIGIERDQDFGDNKFKECVDLTAGKTKLLKLHVIPTSIDRTDSIQVIETVWDSLIFLEEKDRSNVYVSDQNYQYKSKLRSLPEILEDVKSTAGLGKP